MQTIDIDSNLVGTFEGGVGDQFSEMLGKVDVYIDEGDPPSDGVELQSVSTNLGTEQTVELTLRVDKPVDESRIRVEIPEYAAKELITRIQDILDQ